MEDIRLVYENLTGVNIDEQRRLWDERGKGYFGEYLVFNQLYQYVQGDCKILMNVNVPTCDGKTTEIDLLLLHETGIYVFEVKHHKGTIYGDSDGKMWTQYFRTAPNSTFNNPIKQNSYHIAALRMIFPNAPLKSIIVFTNDKASLKVTVDHSRVAITRLGTMMYRLDEEMHGKPSVYTREQLNDMFMRLLPFSPMNAVKVEMDGVAIPFYDYLENIRAELLKAKTRFVNRCFQHRRQIGKYGDIRQGFAAFPFADGLKRHVKSFAEITLRKAFRGAKPRNLRADGLIVDCHIDRSFRVLHDHYTPTAHDAQ